MRKVRSDPKRRATINKVLRDRLRADPVARMLYTAKARSKILGIRFNLTRSDLEPLPKTCPVLGIRLRPSSCGFARPNSYSLDRINPRKGYVRGNVTVISHRANQIKNDATAEELEAVARWLRSQ
jgi:hypothetical protein